MKKLRYVVQSMIIGTVFFFCTSPKLEAGLIYSRSAFESLAKNLTTQDFNNLVGTPEFPQNYPFGTGHMNLTSDGLTVNGIRYVGDRSGNDGQTYLLGPDVDGGNYSIDGTVSLVGGTSLTEIFLPKGLSAFGADFGFIADRTGTVGLKVYLTNGSVESDNVFVGEPKQFFGYVGEEIDRIEIDLAGNYLVFDNVAFGPSLSAVPEPSTITLAILGLGGCVERYRRRFRLKQAS